MGVLRHVAAPEGVPAGRGYSQVVTGRGRLVVVSGQVAQDEHGGLVGPSGEIKCPRGSGGCPRGRAARGSCPGHTPRSDHHQR